MRELLLYTTSACHLCEQAEQLIYPVLDALPFRLRHVEIADSDQLIEQYGIRIPVMARPDNGTELGWPFDSAQLIQFLSAT